MNDIKQSKSVENRIDPSFRLGQIRPIYQNRVNISNFSLLFHLNVDFYMSHTLPILAQETYFFRLRKYQRFSKISKLNLKNEGYTISHLQTLDLLLKHTKADYKKCLHFIKILCQLSKVFHFLLIHQLPQKHLLNFDCLNIDKTTFFVQPYKEHMQCSK